MKVLILGGGIAGLVTSWAFQSEGHQVTLLEPAKPGGEFLAGGLKYLNRSKDMIDMLRDLKITFTNYSVNGGILLQGEVKPYPGVLKSLETEYATRIQHDHWRKTRRTEPDKNASRSMNDPESVGTNNALGADPSELVRRLTLNLGHGLVKDVCEMMTHEYARGVTGRIYKFDAAIVTLPLWIANRVLPWLNAPFATAMKLNLAQVTPLKDPYPKWDYVYTPYTPENLVHRISPRESGWSVEFNGAWVEGETNIKLTNELNFLFQEGWALSSMVHGLNGHLLPIEREPGWAPNVQPLGRFAQWDPRATTDVVLARALELARKALPWKD